MTNRRKAEKTYKTDKSLAPKTHSQKADAPRATPKVDFALIMQMAAGGPSTPRDDAPKTKLSNLPDDVIGRIMQSAGGSSVYMGAASKELNRVRTRKDPFLTTRGMPRMPQAAMDSMFRALERSGNAETATTDMENFRLASKNSSTLDMGRVEKNFNTDYLNFRTSDTVNAARGRPTTQADRFWNDNKKVRSKISKQKYDKATKGRPFMQASRSNY